MKNPRVWLWITMAVILAGVVAASLYARHGGVSNPASQAPVQASVRKGQKAPNFTAATDDGYFDLSKTDRPVFLEVFATWCPHCQRETSIIDNLYQRYKNQVAFVGVTGSNTSMDGQGQTSEQDVLNFVQTFHVQYPVAYDGSLDVEQKYLQGGFPTLVVINRDKTVSYVTSGETSYDELNAAIQKSLH